MNRKNFVMVVLAAAAGVVPTVVRAAQPCPPPLVTVSGGTSATTNCPAATGSSYSTTFSSKEKPINEGGMWVNGKSTGGKWNDVQTIVGRAYGTALMDVERYADNVAHLAGAYARVHFALPADGPVRVRIFDAAGRLVRQMDQAFTAGNREFVWDGADESGSPAPSGILFYEVTAAGVKKTSRIVRLP